MERLIKFNNYCKDNNIDCVANLLPERMCSVSTPTFTRIFTIEALEYIDDILKALNVL